MSTSERFAIALAATAADLPGAELVPERLARAAAAVLPVDGGGISLFFAADRRLPLGASDEDSAEAERLQFTVGEGPCLSAHDEGRPIVADEAMLESRWPTFYDDLLSRTPIRGIISLPLRDGLEPFGALDLYVVPPGDVRTVALFEALTIAREVVESFRSPTGGGAGGADGPAWLDAPLAARRALVWQAMGFINAGLGVTSPDALALLRAHAHTEGMDLDELAARVLDRDVSLDVLALDVESSP
jgi:hypothetical protein